MKIGLIALIIAIIAGAGFYFVSKNKTEPALESSSPAENVPPKESAAPSAGQTGAQTTHSVSIKNFAFDKQNLTIKKGDTVIWTNNDSAPHTATGDSGGPSSPTLNKNGTYSFTYNSTGTFSYKCAFHPSMKGTIIVE